VREIHIYEFLGRKVHDADGKYCGALEEIEVERGDESCIVKNYFVQERGLVDRITAWALADSLRKVIPVREESKPYRVPWDKMDLTDPEHPRITVPKSELQRVRG
jgi:sporulation protein YlmC with PRC-barrel domain